MIPSGRIISLTALTLVTASCATTAGIGPQQDRPVEEIERETLPKPEVAEPAPVSVVSFVTPRGELVNLNIPSRSQSVGAPTNGSLQNPRCIGNAGPGFIHMGDASCATDETVLLTLFAIGELLRDYPDTVPVLLGSLSAAEGGNLKPHKSHQSGRDIDVGFFAAGNRRIETFGQLEKDRLDFEKTFALIVNLIATGQVRMVFINYSLQPYFIEAAKNLGYSTEQIDYLFQYPKGKTAKAGIIRHADGHNRHAHVRFGCAASDAACIE